MFLLAAASPSRAQQPFQIEETTIDAVHAAMRAGTLTCRRLVEGYLRRIDAYDKQGPAINAITVVNPDALATADSLDRRFAATRQLVGPLHCVPMIVKDNFQTIGLQTAAGNLALKGYAPSKDAFQVKRIKEAGAIVLAKSNMAEFAFSPVETVNSVLPGYTKNPYALDRVTAGSSGGTAAAVAADLGEVGLGTDTGNSIRGPSSHQALVGIRSTMGLTSRAGIAPLSLFADIAGPMARSVADAVAVFQVVAGYDPDDPATAPMKDKPVPNYSASLVKDGLKGARIGVLRQAFEGPTVDPEVRAVFNRAIDDLRRAGATVLDTVDIAEPRFGAPVGSRRAVQSVQVRDQPLARRSRAPSVPLKAVDSAFVRSGRYHPSIQTRLEAALRVPAESGFGARMPVAAARSRRAARRGDAHDGRAAARRARLSDVEQSAAPDRRSQHAGRRQQPGLLADDGNAGDHRADGLHARQHAAGGHDDLRTRIRRSAIDQGRVRLRAGDEVAEEPRRAPPALK